MRVEAIIFDVYSTMLEVGPAPADAEDRWQQLFQGSLGIPPRWTRLEFSTACNQSIAHRHAKARGRGVLWPEIHWPSVMLELIPELAGVTQIEREDFIFEHIQTGRTLRMQPEVATTLQWLRRQGTLLGIASNSQAYTLRELEEALGGHSLDLGLFENDLCFWSFQHGFSKPNPHVFQGLTLHLEARGISPGKVLMVGDHPENDMIPARAFEWQTWQLNPSPSTRPGGSWTELLNYLQAG